jgi:glycerol-3-phosphate dehydrogenase
MPAAQKSADAIVIGGGCAGLFILDALVEAGVDALLVDANPLGTGQTTSSQGILHAGVKYALSGAAGDDAVEASEAAALWSEMLRGGGGNDLRGVRVLADHCWLWRSASWAGVAGMLGARLALRTAPVAVTESERPPWLRGVKGDVLKLGETVIDPRSLLQVLASRHTARIVRADVRAIAHTPGGASITIGGTREDCVGADAVILAAGAGNERLSALAGAPEPMQRRPLRQLMIRGALPMVFGHCIDGARTRVTITSDRMLDGTVVWHVGGQIAEDGVHMEPRDFIRHGLAEVVSALPGVEIASCEVGEYLVDRAEPKTKDGRRPPRAFAKWRGPICTVWPIKLVLAPLLARAVCDRLRGRSTTRSAEESWGGGAESVHLAERPWESQWKQQQVGSS